MMEIWIKNGRDGAELLNFFPNEGGSLTRREASFNGVIVTVLPGEPDENGNPTYRRFVSLSVRDPEMLGPVREAAKAITGL